MNISLRYSVDDISMREKVAALETAMRQFPQLDLPPRHTFIQGVYIRELAVPKGAIVVGKLHKQEHVFILSAGDVTVLTERGIERLRAPYQMTCGAGAKRAFYAHEDTVMLTVHRTDETDLEKIEAQLIANDYAELELTQEFLEVCK
jgi:hypothetical protein